MLKREFAVLNDGDIVKLRGGTRQGPVLAFLEDKGQIQFAYEENNGHIAMATLPFCAMDFVASHPLDATENVPGVTNHPTRRRVRGT